MSVYELIRAIRDGSTSIAIDIIESGKVNLNELYDGQTALTLSVDYKRPAIVQALIKAGADPNTKNSTGLTPMMMLMYKGDDKNNYNHENKIELMFNELLPVSDINIENNKGNTALFIALNRRNSVKYIKSLLDYGANIFHVNHNGETVILRFATQDDADDNIDVLQLLLEKSTPELINRKDEYGKTAIEYALSSKHYKTVEQLLDKGAKLSNASYSDIRSIKNSKQFKRIMERVERQINRKNILPDMRPSDLEVRFGVELEICVKLTPECGHESNIKRENFQTKFWVNLFGMYAKSMLSKSPLVEKMRSRYEYMYVSDGEKYDVEYILNLNTFEIEKFETNTIAYDKPFFTVDRSVVCDDYYSNNNNNNNTNNNNNNTKNTRNAYLPDIENTFHMELVSPIMTNLEELKDLLEFIGMQTPSCFVSNDTAGFHVNVSLLNKNTNKAIPLTIDFFTNTFFPRYTEWESEMYPKVRSKHSNYAKCIGTKDATKYPDLYHSICKTKYASIHRKTHELVEFRLFGSSTNMTDLLNYTQQATELLRDSYLVWYAQQVPQTAGARITRKKKRTQKPLRKARSARNKKH
jgi:ankyrin repeat protein